MSAKSFLKRCVIAFFFIAFVIALVGGKFDFISEAGSKATFVPNIRATKSVSLFTDNDSDGKADPGDTLQYSVTINNAGTDATGVLLNDTLNLSTLSGVANISPLAANDTYNTIGNVNIAFPDGAGDLLSNDADVDGGTVILTGFGNNLPNANANAPGATITTTNGGSLKVNVNGSFDYNPPRVGTAIETFFYTISDGQGGTDTSQVTINFSGKIWFINNAAGACLSSCDGRLTNPYTTTTAFQTANTGTGSNPAAGDYIFIYSGTGNYNGSITLLNNQKLIGQGASANILSVTGLATPSGTNQLPGTGGAPTLGTNAVTIANAANATIRGLTIGNTTGTKIITSPNPPNSSFGTLTIGEVTLNGTGQALNLDNGTLAATFASIVTTSSGAQGISLEQVGGSLVSTGGTTVSGNATQCVLITASTANINLGNTSCTGGTIQNTTGADGATTGSGIYLNNAQNVSLTRVRINDHQNNGIFGTGVRGLTIANSLFNGNNGTSNSGTFDESAINLVDIGGNVSITNSFISGGGYNNARFENTVGIAPNLTLTLSGNTSGTMQGSTADVRGTAFLVTLSDGTLDAEIQNNRLTVWWGNAIHVLVQGIASGSSNITGNFADNTNGATAGAGGIWITGGTHTYNISGNTVRHTNGTAISADRVNFGTTMQGTIDGNIIGVAGDNNSGSATGSGIFASHHGPGTTTVKISNNTIRQVTGQAAGVIRLLTGDASGFGGSGTFNATVVGNEMQQTGSPSIATHMAILVSVGTQSGPPNDTDQACLDIGGGTAALRNNITNINTGFGFAVASENRIRVNQQFGTTSRFPGYTGAQLGAASQTNLDTYLLSRNTTSNAANANISFKATVDNGPFAAGVDNITNQAQISGTNFGTINSTTSSIALDAAPDLQITSTDLGVETQPGGTASYTLNYQNVTSIKNAGCSRRRRLERRPGKCDL